MTNTLDPQTITDVDTTSALGIATLWNDAIPFVRHMLDHQVDDIADGVQQAFECDRDDCETHDVRHRDGDETCPCWGCANTGLFTMAQDLRHWLDDLDVNSTAYGFPPSPQSLLSLISDWLLVNDRAPRTRVPAYELGGVYRLLAELADQAKAMYAALTASEETP